MGRPKGQQTQQKASPKQGPTRQQERTKSGSWPPSAWDGPMRRTRDEVEVEAGQGEGEAHKGRAPEAHQRAALLPNLKLGLILRHPHQRPARQRAAGRAEGGSAGSCATCVLGEGSGWPGAQLQGVCPSCSDFGKAGGRAHAHRSGQPLVVTKACSSRAHLSTSCLRTDRNLRRRKRPCNWGQAEGGRGRRGAARQARGSGSQPACAAPAGHDTQQLPAK